MMRGRSDNVDEWRRCLNDLVRVAEMTAPPTELIFGEWYPALRSNELRKGATKKAMLLGIPLLLGRKNDGNIFAMRDLCPHRGIPLSAGWFDGETVQCKYHGWRFEPCSGQCAEIPSLTGHDTLDATKIFANSFPCEQRDGYAWVYVPEPGTGRVGDALPPLPEVPKFSPRYRSAHLMADLPCNVDHGIIGLMDPAHGPFVHQAWWWRSRASIHEKTKHFEPIPAGLSHVRSRSFGQLALLTSCWASMASRSRRRSTSCCLTGGTRRSAAATSGSPA